MDKRKALLIFSAILALSVTTSALYLNWGVSKPDPVAQLTPPPSTVTPDIVNTPAPGSTPDPNTPPTLPPSPQNTPRSIGGIGGPSFLLADEFVDLSNSVDRPNLTIIELSPPITGNTTADNRIVSLAAARGYRLQAIPTNPALLTPIHDQLLQSAMIEDWFDLQLTAAADGIFLDIVSGYRSIEQSRDLFLERFMQNSIQTSGSEYTNSQIAQGQADAVLEATLRFTAIPGYSKHHTGYTIDITDTGSGKSFTQFTQTAGYQWISQNNYENAKRFGFVPSYPLGATDIGPQPESWEYVWVGRERLI